MTFGNMIELSKGHEISPFCLSGAMKNWPTYQQKREKPHRPACDMPLQYSHEGGTSVTPF